MSKETLEPVVGYRAWIWKNNKLCSILKNNFIWYAAFMKASHIPEYVKAISNYEGCITPPTEGHLCGFHGLWQYKDCWLRGVYLTDHTSFPLIFGMVQGYGKIIEHEKGWRASNIRILGFTVPSLKPSIENFINLYKDNIKNLYQPWVADFVSDPMSNKGWRWLQECQTASDSILVSLADTYGVPFIQDTTKLDMFISEFGRSHLYE